MTAGEAAAAVRRGVALFPMSSRGLIEVRGEDRERWLDGMLSNHVAALAEGSEHSGCYALLLTPKGRIVADLHVLLRGSSYWLETRREAVPGVIERLERYIIADDVGLADRSDDFDRLGVEGPGATALLSRAAGRDLRLARDACCELEIGGLPVVVAAFGWSGESAYQLFVATGAGERVARALGEAAGEDTRYGRLSAAGEDTQDGRLSAAGPGLVHADAPVLEVLRIEAGIPMLGAELDEEVLPAEAHLERAISTTKGCYTGQEIVARLRSRGQVNHLLVGLRFQDGEKLPAPGQKLVAAGRESGEVTSVCRSATAGPIGLGYLRREHAEPGTQVLAGESSASVSALPFVAIAGEGRATAGGAGAAGGEPTGR